MRRNKAEKRRTSPDVRYNSTLVQGMINRLMHKGKTSTATRIVYDAFEIIETTTNRSPVEVYEEAVNNASPLLEVKPRRVGGATYQVPVEVRVDRRLALALRWLLAATRERSGKTMSEKLAAELMDAAKNTGAAIKKKEDTHRMAEANRAFAHYRW